jgi:transcriptional regulator with XRE-family HTH domain
LTVAERSNDFVIAVTRQLAAVRRAQKITQDALAERLAIPVQHVRRVEAGQNITLETLGRFADALGVTVSVVFEVAADGPKKPAPSRRQRTRAAKE